MSWPLLQTFVRVAEMGNISAAARSLFLAQSAVSAQISILSRAAGVTLLERTHGRWTLTAPGLVFYNRARELLLITDQLEHDLADTAGTVAGHLVLASTRTISDTILPRIISQFTRAHPSIRLVIIAGNRHDAEMRLAADEVDAALVALPIGSKGLRVEPFGQDTLVAVLPESHRLAAASSVAWADLAGEPCVIFERGSGVRSLLEERLGESFLALNITFELASNDGLLLSVEEKLGITFLPERVVARWQRSSSIVGVRVSDVDLTRVLAFVVRNGKQASSALIAFEQWIRDDFQDVDDRSS